MKKKPPQVATYIVRDSAGRTLATTLDRSRADTMRENAIAIGKTGVRIILRSNAGDRDVTNELEEFIALPLAIERPNRTIRDAVPAPLTR